MNDLKPQYTSFIREDLIKLVITAAIVIGALLGMAYLERSHHYIEHFITQSVVVHQALPMASPSAAASTAPTATGTAPAK